ncbi:MAG: YeeE/YedE family protein [Proteobacteria bacterium]|nr:YeeE/YedE family protein [Pseudomonadota bacterium]
MQDPVHLQWVVAGGAFALAFVFGAVAQKTHFCAMGSVSDIVAFGDWRRMRMWLLAIAVAVSGVTLLQYAGWLVPAKTIYATPQVPWLSHIVGGLLFGCGMTLASGCASKNLVRAGAGNLKAWVVLLVLGIAGYMTLKGLFALPRVYGLDTLKLDVGASVSTLPAIITAHGGAAFIAQALPWVAAAAIAIFVFANASFRGSPGAIAGGVLIGLVVVGGWYVSSHLGYIAEDPATLEERFVATNSGRPESFSFVSPVAYTLELLMLWSDQSRIVTFGIASAFGVAAGAFAMAAATRQLRWESFADAADVRRHMLGGVLMGFGGVTALGCTIGQGLTGLSMLALGSLITFLSIIAGCAATLKLQMWWLEREA